MSTSLHNIHKATRKRGHFTVTFKIKQSRKLVNITLRCVTNNLVNEAMERGKAKAYQTALQLTFCDTE